MMIEKDNVYGENTQTGEVAAAKMGAAERADSDTLAVLGKFKDVNALAKAYGALEAEFTRRSQRLKALEKTSDNWQASAGAGVGAEKLRKHAKERREEQKAFDAFLDSVGKAHTDGGVPVQPEEIGENGVAVQPEEVGENGVAVQPEEIGENGVAVNPEEEVAAAEAATAVQAETSDLVERENQGGMYAMNEKPAMAVSLGGEGNAAELERGVAAAGGSVSDLEKEGLEGGAVAGNANERVFSAVANHGTAEVSSEELYRRVSRDEQVRLRIIGEYLSSIGKTNAPLTAVGAGVPITPPVRAKTIGDAGAMALRYFKQPLQN